MAVGTKDAPTESLIAQTVESAEARLVELEPVLKEAEELRSLITLVKRAEANTGARRGPRAGSGSRKNEFLAVVKERPGITIAEAAEALKMKPNYLYRIGPELVEEGKIRRENGAFFPVEEAEEPAAA